MYSHDLPTDDDDDDVSVVCVCFGVFYEDKMDLECVWEFVLYEQHSGRVASYCAIVVSHR